MERLFLVCSVLWTGYSLRAGILVWNFTFNARNSKPEILLGRTSTWRDGYTYIISYNLPRGQHNIRKTKGYFCSVLFTDSWWQVQTDSPFIGGWRDIACEQEFWFGIWRFKREIPNQKVCLPGPSTWCYHYAYIMKQMWWNTRHKRRVLL